MERAAGAPSRPGTMNGWENSSQAEEQSDSTMLHPIRIETGFHAAYRNLEARMKARAEADGDVFLPLTGVTSWTPVAGCGRVRN